MKKKNNLLSFFSCMALFSLFSCSTNDDGVIQGDEPNVLYTRVAEGMVDNVTEGEFDEEDEDNSETGIHATRSSFIWDADQKLYISKWQNDDVVAVFSTEKGVAAFQLTSGQNSSTAIFTGAGFDLTENKNYYSFSHNSIVSDKSLGNATADINAIHMTYKGQTQNGNGNSDHLGAFDYQAAAGTAGSGNHVRFNYKHLGSVIRFILTLPTESEESVTFTKLTLSDYNATTGEKKFYQPHQIVDLQSSDGLGDVYAPQLQSAELGQGETPDNTPFELTLKTGSDEGITIKKSGTDAERQLFLHMFIPSMALKGQQMKAVLETTGVEKYYVTFGATNFVQGKYYTVTKTLIPSNTIDIRLKVNPDWQLGNTQTRAQGDPGYDKDVHAPKYLYPYIALDGVTEGSTFYAFEKIETVSTDWTQDKDGVYVFNKPLSYSYTGAPIAGRVYAIASDYQLTLSASNESALKELSYSIPSGSDDNPQEYMRNLYSTPLVTSDTIPFTGTVVGFNTNTPSADVTLYHVAAKVDVQWNSETALSRNVSVNDVKNTGLYYFKPTENALESGSYTVSEPITPGTMYMGRQVFYLPQFADPTYSITTGTDNTNNIQFTPSTTNGWTSWLKANIEIK